MAFMGNFALGEREGGAGRVANHCHHNKHRRMLLLIRLLLLMLSLLFHTIRYCCITHGAPRLAAYFYHLWLQWSMMLQWPNHNNNSKHTYHHHNNWLRCNAAIVFVVFVVVAGNVALAIVWLPIMSGIHICNIVNWLRSPNVWTGGQAADQTTNQPTIQPGAHIPNTC